MDINLKQHLKELEESHIKIDVRKSREIFGRILADDFFEIGSSGYIFYREECLGSAGLNVRFIISKFFL